MILLLNHGTILSAKRIFQKSHRLFKYCILLLQRDNISVLIVGKVLPPKIKQPTGYVQMKSSDNIKSYNDEIIKLSDERRKSALLHINMYLKILNIPQVRYKDD